MLRRKSLLISLAAVTLCCVGISPANACGDWEWPDGDESLWELLWDWLTSLFYSGGTEPGSTPQWDPAGPTIDSIATPLDPIVVIA